MTWVKTSLSQIIVKMTSWAAKWIFVCQNKPKFVRNSASDTNHGLFWEKKFVFPVPHVLWIRIYDKLVFTQVINVRFKCLASTISGFFLEIQFSFTKIAETLADWKLHFSGHNFVGMALKSARGSDFSKTQIFT